MFVDVGIQQAMLIHHIVICGLSDSTLFFPIISQKTRFSEKMLPNLKCVLIVSTLVVWHSSYSKDNRARYDGQTFEVWSNIKFNENPSSGCGVVPCGRADGQTDMTKLKGASRNFAKSDWKALYGPQSWATSAHLPSPQHISLLSTSIIPTCISTSSSPKRSSSITFFI